MNVRQQNAETQTISRRVEEQCQQAARSKCWKRDAMPDSGVDVKRARGHQRDIDRDGIYVNWADCMLVCGSPLMMLVLTWEDLGDG